MCVSHDLLNHCGCVGLLTERFSDPLTQSVKPEGVYRMYVCVSELYRCVLFVCLLCVCTSLQQAQCACSIQYLCVCRSGPQRTVLTGHSENIQLNL